MSDENDNLPEQPADHASEASPISGTVPPVEHRWKPGQSGNPKGRPTAGLTIREHVNQLAIDDLTEDELRRVARDKKVGWTRRAAAERALRTLEAGDLSDFSGLLSGEHNLEDLRAMGINTEVVKKFKNKTRKVPSGNGEVEEVIEREIELHDRAGHDFDRVVNQTDGNPVQPVEADIKGDLRTDVSEDQVLKVLNILQKTRPAEPEGA